MPIDTLRRLLGFDDGPPPIRLRGLHRHGDGWSVEMAGMAVHIHRLPSIPLVRPEAAVRCQVQGLVDLELLPPGEGEETGDDRFDLVFGLPRRHHGQLDGRLRRRLVGLADRGEVAVVDGQLTFTASQDGLSKESWADALEDLAKVVRALRSDKKRLDQLVFVYEHNPDVAAQLARKIRRKGHPGYDLRAHADVLVRTGRKLARIVAAPKAPLRARLWGVARCSERHAGGVCEQLLERRPTPDDLVVLAQLLRFDVVARELADARAFWLAVLRIPDLEPVADPVARLVTATRPHADAPWAKRFLPHLATLPEPVLTPVLDAIVAQGQPDWLAELQAQADQAPRAARRRIEAASALLRDRFEGHRGAVSLAQRGGQLSRPDGSRD